MVNLGCDRDVAGLQASFAQRLRLQFLPVCPLPALCCVRPFCHSSPNQSIHVDHRPGSRRDTDSYGERNQALACGRARRSDDDQLP
jgi:hypothetical protein